MSDRAALPEPLRLGTSVPGLGTIDGIHCAEGERFYFLRDAHDVVSLFDDHTVRAALAPAPTCPEAYGTVRHLLVFGQRRCLCGKEMAPETLRPSGWYPPERAP